jgi:hypothetical protein
LGLYALATIHLKTPHPNTRAMHTAPREGHPSLARVRFKAILDSMRRGSRCSIPQIINGLSVFLVM